MAAALNLPFGYTLATWSSAAIAADYHGTPRIGEVFAFLLGAVGAYLLIATISARHLGSVTPVRMRKATLLNVFSVVAAAAVSVVARLAQAPSVGFFVSGFTSTLVYLVCLAALLWLTSWRTIRRRA